MFQALGLAGDEDRGARVQQDHVAGGPRLLAGEDVAQDAGVEVGVAAEEAVGGVAREAEVLGGDLVLDYLTVRDLGDERLVGHRDLVHPVGPVHDQRLLGPEVPQGLGDGPDVGRAEDADELAPGPGGVGQRTRAG